MSMGYFPGCPLPMLPSFLVEHTPDLARLRQRESLDRLEREHLERMRRADRLARWWSALGIATFFAAVALACWGLWVALA